MGGWRMGDTRPFTLDGSEPLAEAMAELSKAAKASSAWRSSRRVDRPKRRMASEESQVGSSGDATRAANAAFWGGFKEKGGGRGAADAGRASAASAAPKASSRGSRVVHLREKPPTPTKVAAAARQAAASTPPPRAAARELHADCSMFVLMAAAALVAGSPCPPELFPVPQSCTRLSTATFSLHGATPAWRIAARLSDPQQAFASNFLAKNLSSHGGLSLKVVDAASVSNTSTHIIAISSAGAGRAEGYRLEASATRVTLAGNDEAGSFYAAVSFAQLALGSSARAIAEVALDDAPDLPFRGYEVEPPIQGDCYTFYRQVADVLADHKMNYVQLYLPVPLRYVNLTTWVYPDAAFVAGARALLAYFRARHIAVGLIAQSKWDPRTLEGKLVRDEPFTIGADGQAHAARPVEMNEPRNGDFERLGPDGKTPVGWTFQRGSTSGQVPCAIDTAHAASGRQSVRCDVEQFPDPAPPSAPQDGGGPRHASRRVPLRANPMLANYSGPLTSDLVPIAPGSTVELRFKASWAGNWTGDFVATVSLYQYESADEATADENPTDSKWPQTLSFLPCVNGDHGHCGGSYAIATLPAWTQYSKVFITMPTARFVRVRVYVGGWGAGQWWVDDFQMRRIDGMLKNVVRLESTDVVVKDAHGATLAAGADYAVEQPAPIDQMISATPNFTTLPPLSIRRVEGGKLRPGDNVSLSFNLIPGSANQMEGSRDVSCYVEPLHWQLSKHSIEWHVKHLEPDWLVPDSFDEQIGMGRDSRTLDSNLTNGAILGAAINKAHALVKAAADGEGRAGRTKMLMWADLIVPDHNGGVNYSWFSGGGRRQPYWPAIELIDKDILQLSWEYDLSPYTQKLIRDDPGLFHNYSLPWVGAGWRSAANVKLWADAVRDSRRRYAAGSTAKGLMCTNWGGGRIEAGLPFVAAAVWNLAATP
jgi:hypothetical protein